jgi:ketosteroid isomerase-like protein
MTFAEMDLRKKALQDIHEALNKKDVDRVVAYFADDADDISPDGIFKDKTAIKRHFE